MGGAIAGKRIGLLAGWASRRNGGVFEALVGQAQLIRGLGAVPIIFATRDEYSEEDSTRFAGSEVHYAEPLGPPSLAYAPALARLLDQAPLDCLHLHGIWQATSLSGARWARRNGGQYVISPHGMLDSWITGRNRVKKALFRTFVERANWRAARTFHALTQDEAEDIRRWIPKAHAEVIPNPAPLLAPAQATQRQNEVVYVGRIHEKKNLAALIDGWRSAEGRLRPDARLTIAGIGEESDIAELKRLVDATDTRVRFIGPSYGAEKQALLERARFMVLPSLSEGLPMAVLDAWSAGLPTIMTKACHLPEGFAANAAIECGIAPREIAQALVRAFALSDNEWQAMSAAALGLAGGLFSSETVARRWESVYSAAMDGASTHG